MLCCVILITSFYQGAKEMPKLNHNCDHVKVWLKLTMYIYSEEVQCSLRNRLDVGLRPLPYMDLPEHEQRADTHITPLDVYSISLLLLLFSLCFFSVASLSTMCTFWMKAAPFRDRCQQMQRTQWLCLFFSKPNQ